ncbi:hypothetical protein [Solidesulfovibrio sp. C21]|uniref:hypothetical protein n=1 Tax=Solidesulfovibrio sp. C21 TaxID=3398613 RepID=UPI0039FD93CD
MELRLAFTEFLFAFCAVVLADRIYGFSDRLLGRFARKSDKPQLQATSANDWYVHFHRSDLTGEEEPSQPAAPAARVTPAVARQPRCDSRPRLRV